MTYYPDLNLNIKKTFWVCPPFPTTIELCKVVADYCPPKKTVLDMGTGTGLIAVYLSKKGCNVIATDVSKEALKLTKKNSKINNAPITLIQSDLYSNIQGRFDIITFVIPHVFSKSNFYGFISYSYNKIVPLNFDYYLSKFLNKTILITHLQKTKKGKILEFLKETPKYLTKDGLVFIIIFEEDMHLLKEIDGVEVLKEIRSKSFPDAFIVIYHYKK